MSVNHKGGRPTLPKSRRRSTQLNLRVKDDLVEMLDVKLLELEREHPGMNWTRAEVARYMLYRALQAEQEDE